MDSPNVTKLTAEETVQMLEDDGYEVPDEAYNQLIDIINKNTSKFHNVPSTLFTKLKKELLLIEDLDTMEIIDLPPIII